MEGLLHKVEWATLMFFAGLFILVECIEKLGLVGKNVYIFLSAP